MRMVLAFRVFFAALFDAVAARRLAEALASSAKTEASLEHASAAEVARPTARVAEAKAAVAAVPQRRSEALTLLDALQREARWLDLVQEPLGSYSDAQVGAAARDVLRSCAELLDRFFGLQPLLDQEEGSSMEVPRGYDPQRFRVVGNVSGDPPFRGQLVHHGWVATRCDLPAWSGSHESSWIVAPAEVESGARG